MLPVNASSTLSFSYLARVTLFALSLLVTLIYLAHIIFPDVANDYYQDKLQNYQQHRQLIEALAIGTSHSRGFYFPALGLTGINFHDAGGDIEEVRMKVQVLLPQSPELRYIFVPISPGTLALSQRAIASDYATRLSTVATNTPLSIDSFLFAHEATISLLLNRVLSIKKFRSAFEQWLHPLFPYVKNTEQCFSLLNNQAIQQKYRVNVASVKQDQFNKYSYYVIHPPCIQSQAITTVAEHRLMIQHSIEKMPNIIADNKNRLISIADELSPRKGKLILVIMPMTPAYYQSTAIQALVPEHLAHLKKLEKHRNIEIYDFHDYFYPDVKTGHNPYFHDADHLALTGAIEFSRALKQAMGL
jgi:hypothetical protein